MVKKVTPEQVESATYRPVPSSGPHSNWRNWRRTVFRGKRHHNCITNGKKENAGCQIALSKTYVLAWQPHICYHYRSQPEKPTFHQVNKIFIASLVKWDNRNQSDSQDKKCLFLLTLQTGIHSTSLNKISTYDEGKLSIIRMWCLP